MASSTRSRKRQARLAFTPLPSSSPATKGYNKQIQDRAAAVSLDNLSSPAKRRKLQGHGSGDRTFDGASESIPTPAASLDHHTRDEIVESSQSDSEPIRSTQRPLGTQSKLSSRRTSRQQRLDFSKARDANSFSSPVKLTSSGRPQSSVRAGIFGTQRQRTVVDISSEESEAELPSPGKLVARRRETRAKKTGTIEDGNQRATRSTRQTVTIDSDSDSERENIIVRSEEPHVIEEDSDDEEDDMPTTAGIQRRKRVPRASPNSFISSSPPGAADSDNEVEATGHRRKNDRAQESDEDEVEPVTPTGRKMKRSRQATTREQEDLAEDLDFLGPSSDVETSARKPRNTQTKEKSAREKALEKLKRRRSKPITEEESDENEGQEAEENGDDELYTEERRPNPLSSSQMFREDEKDEDFIDEDEDEQDPLGVPEGVPIAFTRWASSKPKELFRWAVEWMVQKKINPAFERSDEIYDLTFKKLDDEVRGLAGSKFTSAAWTPAFTTALKARPDIAFEPIDRSSAEHFMRDTCDACNRTGHPATFQIQFQGKPYYRETLEDVPQHNDGEDDESSSENEDDSHYADDRPAYDSKGNEVAPENTVYYVGKFCMGNAQTAHALEHWKYHLNEWVVSWLVRQGYNTPEKIVERDRWSVDKRKKHANKITDRMESEGVIKTLWREFYQNINDARNSKQGRY